MTHTSTDGHRATFQVVTAMEPTPIASPRAFATGPLTASMNATAAASTSPQRVSSS